MEILKYLKWPTHIFEKKIQNFEKFKVQNNLFSSKFIRTNFNDSINNN
jgi:hypothetical protein